MGFQPLDNCPRCGKIFVRVRSICPDCFKKQEEEYLKVASYLRKNSGCNIQELSDQTSVSIEQIRQFILAQRITISDFVNLEYPCESCGTPIVKGRVCTECSNTISQLAAESKHRENTINQETKRSVAYKSRNLKKD